MTCSPSLACRGLLGVSLLLLCCEAVQAANPVTFQVDMTQQSGYTDVYARGSFNNFDTSFELTNNGSGVFTGTVNIANSPGTVIDFKFYYDPGANWENPATTCGLNRTFTLAGGPQTLPVVYFGDQPPVIPGNNVVFQIDMTPQIFQGNFTNGSSTITVSGGFDGWGGVLTNNPNLTGNASNIYSGTVTVPGIPQACKSYKFSMNGGLESPISTGGSDRVFVLVGGNQILPLVYYNDVGLGDLLPVNTLVTFRIDMTGAVATDSHAFDPVNDKVFINGDFLGWQNWNNLLPQVTNNPAGSSIYTITLPLPKGNAVALTYKYSINGPDNEAATGVNHLRYVRNIQNYTLPLDKFGNTPAYQEPSFGQLTIGGLSSGFVPVSWLGRPGVHLQTVGGLGGVWQDLLETDGTNWTNGVITTNGFVSVTNYPTSGNSTFFRLIKPF